MVSKFYTNHLNGQNIGFSLSCSLKDPEFITSTSETSRASKIIFLFQTIGSCSSLQHLSLSHSCLGDDACIILCKSLKDCSKLNTLNLAGCLITPVGANAVANLIKVCEVRDCFLFFKFMIYMS